MDLFSWLHIFKFVEFGLDINAQNYGLEFQDPENPDGRVYISGEQVFNNYLRIQ